jgi:sarcosine oxidase subunit alpha
VFFTWNGRRIEALPGDTIAMALWRGGVLASGVSRKRYRPLGASGSHLQGVLVTVNGQPHVRADQTAVEDSMEVRQQNTWPSPNFDLLRLLRLIPAQWTRGGFEHPQLLRSGTLRFELWERLLMFLAGEVAIHPGSRANETDQRGVHWDGDVVVVGGGPAGRQEANLAVAAGRRTCLISRSDFPGSFASALGSHLAPLDPRVRLLSEHEAIGVYREGTVVLAAPRDPKQAGQLLVCQQLILATGKRSVPPLVPGNDLPGVMEARLALQWAHGLGAALGPAVVVGTGTQRAVAQALRSHGVSVVEVCAPGDLNRIEGTSAVRAVRINGRRVACRVVVHSGPWVADPSLAFQSGATGTLRLVAGAPPSGVTIVGSAASADEAIPVADIQSLGPASVCACMDVAVSEVLQRVREGKSHIEELKRSTSCGMGPCQGFPCWELLRAVTATATGREAYDRPTHRPPRRGLTVAQAAALDGLLELE